MTTNKISINTNLILYSTNKKVTFLHNLIYVIISWSNKNLAMASGQNPKYILISSLFILHHYKLYLGIIVNILYATEKKIYIYI